MPAQALTALSPQNVHWAGSSASCTAAATGRQSACAHRGCGSRLLVLPARRCSVIFCFALQPIEKTIALRLPQVLFYNSDNWPAWAGPVGFARTGPINPAREGKCGALSVTFAAQYEADKASYETFQTQDVAFEGSSAANQVSDAAFQAQDVTSEASSEANRASDAAS